MGFPCWNTARSEIVELTIATLLAQGVDTRGARNFILCAAGRLVAAIGSSGVYLGVHWPTDVLAGWSFGTFWALGWWALGAWIRIKRSEEHTSELQSLMRISYAVFCLKKKINKK